MSNPTVAVTAEAAPKSLLARFFGIITSPQATFRAVVAHPKWFGMMALTTLIVAAGAAAPMFTEAGQEAALENQVAQMKTFGVDVNDQVYERMRQGMKRAPYTAAGAVIVFTPVMAVILTGILFAVFNAGLGGEASFKQLFAVWAHSGVISALAQCFTAPLNLLRGQVGSATTVGVLLPMIDEASFLGRLLGMVDLFLIWWLVVLAIGLGVLYRRRTQPIAMSLMAVYAVIAVVVAIVRSRMGGA
ncbi:MAG: YIP1 family protein [Vicinamibacterales bacterium]